MLTHIKLGERLKDAREGSNFSQIRAAELLGISRQKLINIEKGSGPVDTILLKSMANLYSYSINYFIEDTETDNFEIGLAFRADSLNDEDQDIVNWARKVLFNIKDLKEICEGIK